MRPIRLSARGFTLVELLAAIMIATILMAIGVPSYRSITTNSRMSAEVNGLLGDVQFARSEALKEGQTVTLCASTDGEACTGETVWHSGWIVFSDADGDGAVATATDVLRVQKPFSGSDTFQAPAGLTAITFNREGFALNLPNAGVVLKLHDSASQRAFTRCLSITMAGMTKTLTYTPSTCT